MPAVDRREVRVVKITAAGVARFELARWRLPVNYHLTDHRVLPGTMKFRRRRKAEEFMVVLGRGPIIPRHPMYVTVSRGKVIAARSELSA